jgi:hypothetical protein
MRWAVHVVCMGARRSAYRVLAGRSEGRQPLRIFGIDGRMILKWIFNT